MPLFAFQFPRLCLAHSRADPSVSTSDFPPGGATGGPEDPEIKMEKVPPHPARPSDNPHYVISAGQSPRRFLHNVLTDYPTALPSPPLASL